MPSKGDRVVVRDRHAGGIKVEGVVDRCYFDDWLGKTRLFVDVEGRRHTTRYFTVEDDLVTVVHANGSVPLW